MTTYATRIFAAGLVLGSALALAACQGSETATPTPTPTATETGMAGGSGTTTVPNYPGKQLTATLDAKAEVPGPGEMGASGEATVWVDTDTNKVCYILGVAGLSPTAAHIHEGDPGKAGDVVVPLETPSEMKAEGCADVDHALAQKLADNPGHYYVNVHDEAHPMGAIRGQLKAM